LEKFVSSLKKKRRKRTCSGQGAKGLFIDSSVVKQPARHLLKLKAEVDRKSPLGVHG
jgi:hypothetical protein